MSLFKSMFKKYRDVKHYFIILGEIDGCCIKGESSNDRKLTPTCHVIQQRNFNKKHLPVSSSSALAFMALHTLLNLIKHISLHIVSND